MTGKINEPIQADDLRELIDLFCQLSARDRQRLIGSAYYYFTEQERKDKEQ